MQSVKSRFKGQREFQKSNSPSTTSFRGSSRFPIWQLSYRRHIGKQEDLGDEVAPSRKLTSFPGSLRRDG